MCVCTCGEDVRRGTSVPVTAEEAATSGAVIALSAGGDVSFLPPVLAPCDGSDLVRLAMCLGMMRTGWRAKRRIATLAAAGAASVAAVMASGVEALRDWPGPLRACLAAEAARASERPGRYGARKTLGGVYGWVRDMEGGPIRNAVLDEMRGHVGIDQSSTRLVHRSKLLAGTGRRDEVVNLAEARSILGRSHATVRKLLDAGTLACSGDDGRGASLAIRRGDVETMAACASDAMTLEAAARRLAVSKSRIRRLVDAGLIDAVGSPGIPWRISAASLDGMMSRLEGMASGRQTGGVGFEHVVRVLGRRGTAFADVLAGMLSGSPAVVALDTDATGLKRLRIRLEAADPSDGGTVRAAAGRLGIKWEVAAHLVERGLLEASAEGVGQFRESYVSGADLARALRTSPKTAIGRLAGEGRRPVTGPSVDGGRQYFYRRLDEDRRT